MTDEKKDNSWYDIWQNWMAPEAESTNNTKNGEKDKIDDWFELWSRWMAPDAIDNKKDDEK